MKSSTFFEKETENKAAEIWTTAKDLQRIIDTHENKSKTEGFEPSINDFQNILDLCHKIIHNLQGKSSKENGKKVVGKTNSKDGEGYLDKYYIARSKELGSMIDSLKKQTDTGDEKNLITKVKSMNTQIQTYKRFIDHILEYPKSKTFPVQQKKIPFQQEEKIKQINQVYLQFTSNIKELMMFQGMSKAECDKDFKGTIKTLLIDPISALLKEKTEEKNRNIYLNTVFTNIITANFKPIESKKYSLDPVLTEHLNKLNSQLESISSISSGILEKMKGYIDKYSQNKNIKNSKKTGMVNLLQIKTKIDEVCQFFDKVYNLPLVKQQYGKGDFSHLCENYKSRLDIYHQILKNNDKIQEEKETNIRESEKRKLFEFVSQLCEVISRKEKKFMATEIVPSQLHILIKQVRSMKSKHDLLIRDGEQKDKMIKNLQDAASKTKGQRLVQTIMTVGTGITTLLNPNCNQPAKAQKSDYWQGKSNDLFIENSELSANNKSLLQQNQRIKSMIKQNQIEIQEQFHKLANILPSNQRLSLKDLSMEDIIRKITDYNKSLATKYQQRQRNQMQMSAKIKDLQATISSLMDHIKTLENQRDNTNQKIEQFQKLGQRLAQVTSLLANNEEKIPNLQEKIKSLQQDKVGMKLQHTQELEGLRLNASTYPQQIQSLKNENKLLIDELYFLRQNENKPSSLSQQENVERNQLINEFNQRIEYLQQSLASRQNILAKCQDKLNQIVDQTNEMKEYNILIASSMQSFKQEKAVLISQYLTDFSSHILSLQETIKQQTQSYNSLLSKNELLEANNTQLTIQMKKYQENMTKKLSQLIRELRREKDDAQLLRSQMKMKDMEIETLQMSIQLIKEQSQGPKQRRLQDEVSKPRNDEEDLHQKLKQIQDQLQESQEAIKRLQKLLEEKQQEYSTKLHEQELKRIRLPQVTLKKGASEVQLREILRKEITEQFQEQLISLKERFNQSFASMLREQGYYEGIKQITPFSMLYVERLFQGNIFQDKIHYKFRVLQHLSTLNSCIVQQTKLMYKMDPRNNTNFHVYIDNTPDMLFVVMTKTGTVIAGYYSGVYQNAIMTAPGLLISVTNNDSFTLKPNNRAMVYDPYFIIFGNAEFRVRSGQSKVFCNFGIMNSYYEHRNKRVGDFLCAENNREVDIEYFEIFQVIYEA